MSQTSPVVLCMQNNMISIRITSFYGSQPSSVVFECKTATFGSELQVSMGPRLHLRFFAFKTAPLAPELQVSMGPIPHLWNVISIRITSLYGFQPSSVVFACKTTSFVSELQISMGPRLHLRFFAFKTAPLAPELLVSMGTSPHLWFFQAKQRL